MLIDINKTQAQVILNALAAYQDKLTYNIHEFVENNTVKEGANLYNQSVAVQQYLKEKFDENRA